MIESTKRQSKYLLIMLSCVALVSSAVPICLAQSPEPVKSTDALKPTSNETTTSQNSDPVKSPPASSSAATKPSGATTGSTSSSAADDFIAGSEVLPAPEKTTAQSDDFVKKQKPSMDLALVLYKNNEFKQALLVLEKLPQNEQVHYYTGLCYKSLGNIKDATTHLAWVAYYAKDPKLKSYAFEAIRRTKPSHANIKRSNNPYETGPTPASQVKQSRHEDDLRRLKLGNPKEWSGGY